ncbi:MAG: Na-translocating system protein MpsB [Acidimicrobiales bacterium]
MIPASVAVVVAAFAPLVGAALALSLGDARRSARVVTLAGVLAFAAALVLVVMSGLDEDGTIVTAEWMDASIDRVSALLLTVVMGTVAVIAGFSSRSLDDDGRASRYFALVGIVAFGSAMVVLPVSPLLLALGWILSGWALVGLVGFESTWSTARRARARIRRTLLIGDLALLGGLVLASRHSDGILTGNAADATDALRNSTTLGFETLDVVMVLVVVAGASRSAMVPFQRWLIGTLAAPTPVSALVHAGLVSGAGLLLLRFASPFVASDIAVALAFALGVVTIVVATGSMLVRSDVKGTLAWSTVAQMAFMVVQCSVGAFSSAVFHIAGHGMYKAALFLGSGDTAAGGLRARRRPPGAVEIPRSAALLASAAAAAVAVGVAGTVIRPDVSPAGEILVFAFAWLTIATGMHGWLTRAPFTTIGSVVVGTLGSVVAAMTYVGGLRLAEAFMKPSVEAVAGATVVGSGELVAVMAVVAGAAGTLVLLPGTGGAATRDRLRHLVVRLGGSDSVSWRLRTESTGTPPSEFVVPSTKGARRAEIRADVSQASAVIAPQWPLSSFVAVNPLGGMESLGFDTAAETARRWHGAKTHLTLDEYRRDHELGLSRAGDLVHVALYRFTELCERAPVAIGGQAVSPVDVIVADLLHGPDSPQPARVPTALERRGLGRAGAVVDDVVSSWLSAYVEPPHWPAHRAGESFVTMGCRLMVADPRLASLLSAPSRRWVQSLGSDPAVIIDAAFAVSGVADDDRVDEVRSQLCRLAGWSGLAKWRSEWAQPDEQRPPLTPIDVVAIRALLEAAVFGSGTVVDPRPESRSAQRDDEGESGDEDLLDARVAAVAAVLAPRGSRSDRAAIRAVLSEVPAQDRASLWLEAQERTIDAGLLSKLSRLDPGRATTRPDAQMVFCIDVRSEGLRSHVEALGNFETIGFAGFFGVPMQIRKLGWDHHEPRCPVLVAPAISASEQPREHCIEQAAAGLGRQRTAAGLLAAHAGAKHGPGSPFALAETAGWFLGPRAAWKTFRPGVSAMPAMPPTRMLLDDDEVLLEQRTFFAESVLKTMGLTDRFAPIVVLCGHTSRTTNNPHATALECGACAGASGDDNARAVAALLNSPDVRHGLETRGIAIPDDTWFAAGLHDTAADRVTLLDVADIPTEHRRLVDTLEETLEVAGRRQAAARSTHLPGTASKVRDRGADWAQVRPEWGLARNAAFIIGPRSLTAGIDLEGRAFLHTYDAEDDPTGRVLETIMTAPLVVGHWISSQYYFSTVDPQAFGAGDKLLHNPIGTTGVISGDGGDLRVGLPLQSTHVDGRRFHQPVRLLAVIQADLTRIEGIIAANPILQTLTGGSWLRIAGRSQPHERWSTRTPSGTWIETPQAFDADPFPTASHIPRAKEDNA